MWNKIDYSVADNKCKYCKSRSFLCYTSPQERCLACLKKGGCAEGDNADSVSSSATSGPPLHTESFIGGDDVDYSRM